MTLYIIFILIPSLPDTSQYYLKTKSLHQHSFPKIKKIANFFYLSNFNASFCFMLSIYVLLRPNRSASQEVCTCVQACVYKNCVQDDDMA